MNCVVVIDGLMMAISGVILIASVVPLCMMPYRMIQAFREKVKLEVEYGKQAYDHIFAWLTYGFVEGGVVYSLFIIGLIDRELSLFIICFVGCAWMGLLLVCYVAAEIYKRIVVRRDI